MITEKFYKLPLVLDPQPEGGWTITCPVLPELITEADTWDEIRPKVSRVLQAVVTTHKRLKKPLRHVLNPLNSNAPFLIDTVVRVKAGDERD